MPAYAGIGSRKTPEPILQNVRKIAEGFSRWKWSLRSGGAEGADSAFVQGARTHRGSSLEIFRPEDVNDAALDTVEKYHPSPRSLKPFARLLMARNAQIILGRNLDDPVEVVYCWTPDGAEANTTRETGGTGQAIRIAVDHGIPVKNLYHFRYRIFDHLPIGVGWVPDEISESEEPVWLEALGDMDVGWEDSWIKAPRLSKVVLRGCDLERVSKESYGRLRSVGLTSIVGENRFTPAHSEFPIYVEGDVEGPSVEIRTNNFVGIGGVIYGPDLQFKVPARFLEGVSPKLFKSVINLEIDDIFEW